MATDTRTPSLRMTLSEPAPPEVAVGARLVVRVQVACVVGCDRRGMLLQVTAPDGAITAHAIEQHDGVISESSDITLEIPAQVGEHVWDLRLPAHDAGDVRHDDHTLAVVIRAKPL